MTVKGKVDDKTDMVVDFKKLKERIDYCLPDHDFLNEVWAGMNPTAENICGKLHEMIKDSLSHVNVKLVSIEVWETPNVCARLS